MTTNRSVRSDGSELSVPMPVFSKLAWRQPKLSLLLSSTSQTADPVPPHCHHKGGFGFARITKPLKRTSEKNTTQDNSY